MIEILHKRSTLLSLVFRTSGFRAWAAEPRWWTSVPDVTHRRIDVQDGTHA